MLTQYPHIFERAGKIPDRRYLRAITKWKRIGSWESQVSENSSRIIRDVTKNAFSDAPTRDAEAVHDQIKTLTQLHGVGPAIASTILTFRAPEVYTVMDWRAVAALAEDGEWGGEAEADIDRYPEYLDRCYSLSEETSMTLRDVDRALWVLGLDSSDGS